MMCDARLNPENPPARWRLAPRAAALFAALAFLLALAWPAVAQAAPATSGTPPTSGRQLASARQLAFETLPTTVFPGPGTRAEASASGTASAKATEHVLVLLTSGLSWRYINATDTPNLAAWAAGGTMFNMVPPAVREWGCPEDVSLAMSAGTPLTEASVNHSPSCSIQRMFSDAPLPLWQDANFATIAQHLGNTHKIGAFAQALHEARVASRAIGTQAGALLVTPDGLAPTGYSTDRLSDEVIASRISHAAAVFPLTVADVNGANFEADPERSKASAARLLPLGQADTPPSTDFPILMPTDYYRDVAARTSAARAEAVISQVAPGTKVYFVSLQALAATEVLQPGFVSYGPGAAASSVSGDGGAGDLSGVPGTRGLGWSAQVRQVGNIHYSSIVPAILADFGVDTLAAPGASSVPVPASASPSSFDELAKIGADIDPLASLRAAPMSAVSSDASGAERAAELASLARKASMIVPVRGSFVSTLTQFTIVYTLVAGLILLPVVRGRIRKRGATAPVVSVTKNHTANPPVAGTATADATESNHGPAPAPASNTGRAHTRDPRRCQVTRWLTRAANGVVSGGRWASDFVRIALSVRPVRWVCALLGLWIAALPAGALISTWAWPWWMSGSPQYAMFAGTYAVAALIAASAAVTGRWHAGAPMIAIGTVTAAVILGDVATGSRTIADSPIGFNTLLGARFYGLGNEAFSFESTGVLLALGGLLGWAARKHGSFTPDAVGTGGTSGESSATGAASTANATRGNGVAGGRRAPWWALAMAALVGVGAIAIGVWPTFGADFGGAIALVPALVVLLLLASGRRVRVRVLVMLGVGGLALSMLIALADWLRPATSRTHLGNFVQALIDGGAWEIVWRKLSVNLRLLVSLSHRWIVLAGLVFLVLVAWPWLKERYARAVEQVGRASAGRDAAGPTGVVAGSPGSVAGSPGSVSETAGSTNGATSVSETAVGGFRATLGAIVRQPLGYMLASVLVCTATAFAVNDSGIVLPGSTFQVLMPALAATVFLEPQHFRRSDAK
ncbi:hypothetical protein J2S49_000527 [Arcanobacterium wilhelmae]|uniref:Uncharacterized protein n=1 Tax=Arcanobacterium wilhelmae TaxID=1803177 RepID=A0ABT9NB54_9ACTO|nr:hypothetical protein [Arcanobacterium wilhelmae]MDP9800451.1 hypothetical protein [Arcanobacterium wilhelmae]